MSWLTSPPRECIYDVPMALDHTLVNITDLNPKGADARNNRIVGDSRNWTVGPMPVHEFMKYFVGSHRPISTEGMLSHTDAFKSVPQRAVTAAEIYQPLVRDALLKSRCGALNRTADRGVESQ